MRTRFLLDENLPPRLKRTILRYNANIDVLRVGNDGAPAWEASDAEEWIDVDDWIPF